MTRALFVLGLLLMAGGVGVLGYQLATFWIMGDWPAVPVRFVWSVLVRAGEARWGGWVGSVPVSVALLASAYLALLASDQLRQRFGRDDGKVAAREHL
jgi:hypothetical protein